MNMKNLLILLLAPAIFIAAEGKILPNDFLKDINTNKKVQIKDLYKDGPLAINFWNLACTNCFKEMKFLNEYHEKYADKGFKVVSINVDNTKSLKKVKMVVRSKKYKFQVISDPRSSYFNKKMGASVMPFLVLVNSDGTIYKEHVGFADGGEVELEKQILGLISNNLDPSPKSE
tara:strand:- start:454 stop:975 length:522 start_codon:yes stop_codon:yes gene_type:complete